MFGSIGGDALTPISPRCVVIKSALVVARWLPFARLPGSSWDSRVSSSAVTMFGIGLLMRVADVAVTVGACAAGITAYGIVSILDLTGVRRLDPPFRSPS